MIPFVCSVISHVRRRSNLRKTLMTLVFLSIASAVVFAIEPSHLDKTKNPAGCSVCHTGHGVKGSSTLRFDKKELCFACHSSAATVPPQLRAKTDILSVFQKRYRHPVLETSQYHEPFEELPEKETSAPRHVACQDCHRVHESTSDRPWKKVKGYSAIKIKKKEADEEYEVCYLCHADSLNRPPQKKNIADLMDSMNPSYHPVEARGKNGRVPSLIPPLNSNSKILCTDCHGNNDPFGPKGPHGSDYEYILKARYEIREVPESYDAYELCYSCHDRQSILGNQSFQKHKEHIVYQHIPCAACHESHGSKIYPHLIDFNSLFVLPFPSPSYIPSPTGRSLCYLRCHVGGRQIVHDNQFYNERRWP